MESSRSPMSCTIFNELRLQEELCDVLICVDNVEFRAHKIILCSCSNYFRVLFSSRWNDTEKRVYKIHNVSPGMMQLIIEYAYTRTVPVTADNVGSLLATAAYFNVTGIIELCGKFLKSHLSPENCISTWKLTETYNCPDLQEAAYVFILHHFEDVTKVSTHFLELTVNDLKNIIEKDKLSVRQETSVFEAVLNWIAHDPQNRRQHVVDLLGRVRLAQVQPERILNSNILRYMKDNEQLELLLINTLTEMYHLNMYGPASSDFTKPLSRPRLPYAVLFAIGGCSGADPTNAIETYDTHADQWVNVTCKPESPIAYHGTAYLKGFIYIIGGFDSEDYLSCAKRFNPLQKTWQEVAPMHSQRCYVSVAVLNNNIYATGGFNGHVYLNTVERYEPETNQWTMVAPMHEQRSDTSATTLHEKVYICGGFDGIECLMTAEVYNATTDQWTVIAPMGSTRCGAGVMAYGNEVYVVGGFDGAVSLRSAEAYNPVTNTWRNIPQMLSPHCSFGIGVMEDRLFVVGVSYSFTITSSAEYYDKNTNEWNDIHDMSVERRGLSCCVVSGLPNVWDYAARRNCHMNNSSSTSRPPV